MNAVYDLFITFVLAMTPLGELRVAIPYGVFANIHPLLVFITAFAGNMVPVIVLLHLLPKIEKYVARTSQEKAEKNTAADSVFLSLYTKWRSHTFQKHSKKFQRIGGLTLITFVAIPLPLTGAWSGALAAVLFGIPFKNAIMYIGTGVFIAGIIVTLVSIGIF